MRNFYNKHIDHKFKKNPEKFFFQSTMTALMIFIILHFLDLLTQTAIISVLGASSFIIFASPKSYFSRVNVLIGGYIIGIGTGIFFGYLSCADITKSLIPLNSSRIYLFASFAVGISVLIMTVLNFEHPPACGMALSLVLNPWNFETVFFIIASVTILALVKQYFDKHLIDLV